MNQNIVNTEKKKRGRPKGSKTVNHFAKERKKRVNAYTDIQAKLVKYIMRRDKQMTTARFEGITKAMAMLERTTPPLCDTKREKVQKAYDKQRRQYYACLNRDNTDMIVDVMSFGGRKNEVAIRNVLKGYISLEGCCLAPCSKRNLKVAINIHYLQTHIDDPCFSQGKVYEDVTGEKPSPYVLSNVRKYVILITQLARTEELHYYAYVIYNANLKKTLLDANTTAASDRENILNEVQKDLSKQKEKEQQRQSILDHIEKQNADLDAYIENKQPYTHIHQRRYDYEVKNQPKSNDEFKAELRAIYEDAYDYSPVNYVNARTIVQVYCIKHQRTFKRMPGHLLLGYGCPLCNKEQGKTWKNTCLVRKTEGPPTNKRWDKKKFIKESEKKHGKGIFDYSFVEYKNNDTPVLLIRKSDNKEFYVAPCEHLRHDADFDGTRKYFTGTSNDDKLMVIRKVVRERLDGKYLVPEQKVDHSNVTLVCPDHGNFQYSMASIRSGCAVCPDCKGKSNSIGERKVEQYLDAKGIEYKTEYHIVDTDYFPEYARVDFYLPNKNTFVEFQGEQHYMDIKIRTRQSRSLSDQMERDYNMRRYCADHGIMLIEIPYQFRDDVAVFLDRFL